MNTDKTSTVDFRETLAIVYCMGYINCATNGVKANATEEMMEAASNSYDANEGDILVGLHDIMDGAAGE